MNKWMKWVGIALTVAAGVIFIYTLVRLSGGGGPVSEVEAVPVETQEAGRVRNPRVGVSRPTPPTIELPELADLIKAGEVITLSIVTGEGEAFTVDEETIAVSFGTLQPGDIIPTLKDVYGVTAEELAAIEILYPLPATNWGSILFALLPIFLIFAFYIWTVQRQKAMMGGSGPGSSFLAGKGRGKKGKGDERPKVSFGDVAGCDEAKAELREVIEFLKEPERFHALGAHVPRGVILVGPPGCGKTLLARAVAGEADVPFFPMAGSEFVEMYVGLGAKRVRELFARAKRAAPSIIFVDEIDAMGGARGGMRSGGDREYAQTLTQILNEMDGFDTNENVIVIAATNRPDILDKALLRAGRFDRRVVLDRPDMRGREAILKVHVRGKPLAGDVDLGTLAKLTPGLVGADIENLVNEAAILATRRDKKVIEMAEFQEAIERVIAGPERKSRLISEEEKRITAYHEAGHALVAHVLPKCDPVHKVSIIARGMAAGYTIALPEEDRSFLSKAKFQDDLAFALGGRAAEELVFGPDGITTGAANDLERVKEIARRMVVRYGMSNLGLQSFTQSRQDFLGVGFGGTGMAPETARLVDVEVDRILDEAYGIASAVLRGNQDVLNLLVEALMEVETLDREEFLAIVDR